MKRFIKAIELDIHPWGEVALAIAVYFGVIAFSFGLGGMA